MVALILLIDTLLRLFQWAVILTVIMSWLLAFNVVNPHNRIVYIVMDILARITEPALRFIRRFMPNLGSVDISPLILLLAIIFLRNFIRHDLTRWLL